MKLDKFTWIIIVIVAAILIAAVVSVNLTDTAGGSPEYLTEDTPAAPIYNVFLALQQGNTAEARRYYAQAVLAEMDKQEGYSPLQSYSAYGTQRLRITNISTDEATPERAYVSFIIDNYTTGGLFGSGSSYSYERTVEVIREDGAWKINGSEYFY